MSMKTKAFTLVELLVCLAVVIILLAIWAPSLSGSRERARRVICKSNLHQLQVVQIAHAETYREVIISHGRIRTEELLNWEVAAKAFGCPSDPNPTLEHRYTYLPGTYITMHQWADLVLNAKSAKAIYHLYNTERLTKVMHDFSGFHVGPTAWDRYNASFWDGSVLEWISDDRR